MERLTNKAMSPKTSTSTYFYLIATIFVFAESNAIFQSLESLMIHNKKNLSTIVKILIEMNQIISHLTYIFLKTISIDVDCSVYLHCSHQKE